MFCPEHTKRDQNQKFTLLSETPSIPVPFLWESPPPLQQEWKVHITVLSTQSCNVFQASHDFTNLSLWRVYFCSHAFSKSHTNNGASVAPHPPPPPGRARRFVSYASYSCRSRGGAGPPPTPSPLLIFKSNKFLNQIFLENPLPVSQGLDPVLS